MERFQKSDRKKVYRNIKKRDGFETFYLA